MELITVNSDLCVSCGQCVKVCPAGTLTMGAKGPEAIPGAPCLACGHCVAVCPSAALDNAKAPLKNQPEAGDFPVLNPETAERFLRSRRSIRCYKKTSVPEETLLNLVNMARFAPTGTNSQGLSFIVVADRKIMEKAVEAMIDWMEELTGDIRNYMVHHIRNYREKGIDSVLRGAPNLIIATAQGNSRNGRPNAISALTYLELYATSLGLGSCWAGFFEACAASGYAPLIDLFAIPEGQVIAGAVMVGYPQFRYQRLTDRNPLSVTVLK